MPQSSAISSQALECEEAKNKLIVVLQEQCYLHWLTSFHHCCLSWKKTELILCTVPALIIPHLTQLITYPINLESNLKFLFLQKVLWNSNI